MLHTVGLPTVSLGAVYHLLVLLALEVVLGVALIGWRYTRNPDHRRSLWAFAGLLALRIPLLLSGLLDLSIIAPIIGGLEVGSIVLLGWVFVASALDLRARALYLLAGLGLTLLCIVVFLRGWGSALTTTPGLSYADFWQQSFWHATGVLLILIAVLVLRRHQRHNGRWLPTSGHAAIGLGFLAQLISSLLPSRPGQVVMPGILSGAGWLLILAGYLLSVVAACRIVLQDMWAYREKTRSASQEALRYTQELLSLVETTRAVSESLDLDTVLSRVAKSVTTALNADRGAIFLANPGEFETIRLVAHYSLLQRADLPGAQVTTTLAEQSLLDHALKGRSQLILNPEAHNERLEILYGLLDRQEVGPTIVQPLSHQDRVLGVLVVGNDRSQRPFGPSEGRLCQSIAAHVATAIENAHLYRDLEIQTDQLSGLLQSQEQGLRQQTAILESLSDGVIVSDLEGLITVVNTAAERTLDTGRDRILGRSVESVLGHSTLGTKADWSLAVESGAPLQTVFERESKIVHVNAAPVLTSTGNRVGVVAVLRDITKETEAERAKSSFIAAISHELRTPITAIRGYAEALSSGMVGAVSETQSHFLGIIRDNALRMFGSTENLIATSEIEMGFLSLEYEETDLHLLIGDVLLSFKNQVENRKLDVRLALDDDLPVIEADPSRVRQILDNLVSNAIKFTYPGGRITVEAQSLVGDTGEAPMHCTIAVSDTGIGISQEEEAHIWERFYRPASPLAEEAASGVGMGLSIVRSLAEAHGGRVWMESAPSVGSVFTVLLPIKRAQLADQQGS